MRCKPKLEALTTPGAYVRVQLLPPKRSTKPGLPGTPATVVHAHIERETRNDVIISIDKRWGKHEGERRVHKSSILGFATPVDWLCFKLHVRLVHQTTESPADHNDPSVRLMSRGWQQRQERETTLFKLWVEVPSKDRAIEAAQDALGKLFPGSEIRVTACKKVKRQP